MGPMAGSEPAWKRVCSVDILRELPGADDFQRSVPDRGRPFPTRERPPKRPWLPATDADGSDPLSAPISEDAVLPCASYVRPSAIRGACLLRPRPARAVVRAQIADTNGR